MARRYFSGCLLLSLLAVLLALPGPQAAADASDGGVIHLFNGKDLTNFYTWLIAPETGGRSPYGKNNDPEKVFTVRDGMIRISGQVYGGLITEREYGNYHLTTEFRWGDETSGNREKRARD